MQQRLIRTMAVFPPFLHITIASGKSSMLPASEGVSTQQGKCDDMLTHGAL